MIYLRFNTGLPTEEVFMKLRKLAMLASGLLLLAVAAFAQTGGLQGDVKGPDGKPLVGAQIQIDRTDIKGTYKVKTDKKGHWLYAGLPLGMYKVSLQIDGKEADSISGVKTTMGDTTQLPPFDLQKKQQTGASAELAAEEQRGMSAEQKAALQKSTSEREAALKKNKELSDSFNAGMTAMQSKAYDVAISNFTKASTIDPNQHVVWAQLADAYMGQAATQTGADQTATMQKGLDAFAKAIELKADDASYHNNYGLALAKDKKIPEAQAELTKAAQLDPPNAAKYYYNLGALLVNSGQNDAAGDAFKKAIDANPDYADAQYQYGIFLVSKAQISADGKVSPVPGTQEAFQKYLELQPNGQFADSAKAMLASMGASVGTTYSNPTADSKKSTTKKKQ
jgi:tetratricopeptide (TPR) repeat protein